MDMEEQLWLPLFFLSICVVIHGRNKNASPRSPIHCRWDCKLVQTLEKSLAEFLKTLKTELSYDPVKQAMDIHPKGLCNQQQKYVYTHVYYCSTYASKEMETASLSITWWRDDETESHLHIGTLLSRKEN